MTAFRSPGEKSHSRFVWVTLFGFMLVLCANSNAEESVVESVENGFERGLGDSPTKSSGHSIGELLVGDTTSAQLFDAHPRFARGYEEFKTDAQPIWLPEDARVLLFFGTWCHDSEREVPRLIKLLEVAGLNEEKFTLIGLDYRKRDPEGWATKFNVRYTPTAIFMRGGLEVGRIVERPERSLYEDITMIFGGSG